MDERHRAAPRPSLNFLIEEKELMTINEYVDPARFPLTTQRALSRKRQLLIDAFNYYQLKEFLESSGIPSESQRKRWAELQEKMKHHAALTVELAKKAKKRKGE
jgi:hypothetical protein